MEIKASCLSAARREETRRQAFEPRKAFKIQHEEREMFAIQFSLYFLKCFSCFFFLTISRINRTCNGGHYIYIHFSFLNLDLFPSFWKSVNKASKMLPRTPAVFRIHCTLAIVEEKARPYFVRQFYKHSRAGINHNLGPRSRFCRVHRQKVRHRRTLEWQTEWPARPSPDDAHRFSIDSSSIDVPLADMRERLGTRFLSAIPELARFVITILHVVVVPRRRRRRRGRDWAAPRWGSPN